MNQFIKGVLTEQLAKLKEDKEELDDKIRTMENELRRLKPIQEAMQKDIMETESFLKGEEVKPFKLKMNRKKE